MQTLSLVFDMLDLADKTLETNDETARLPLGLGRIQFLLDLSMVLQEFIHSRHDDRQPIGVHGLFDLYSCIRIEGKC